MWRFHLHDRAGNQTLTLASAGADLSALTFAGFTASIGSTDTVTTFATFSTRGEALATVEPDRLLATGAAAVTIERERSYNAFGEVASETDARGNVTEFKYNAMGRLVERKAPQVSVTAEDGGTATIRPTETYGYDIAGRLVAVTDANGHATTRLLLAGTGHQGTEALVREEYHPDTGVVQTKYDVFRDARVTINEVGNTEQRSYDKLGRLVQQEHAARSDGVQLIDHYAYDAAGQRTKHWLSQGGTTLSGISSYAETTDYDVEGRVVRTVQMGGDTTQYRYAWNAGLETSLGELGGWDKVTINPAGLDMTERHDLFGRAIEKSDFGDHTYDYSYDEAGRLVAQTVDLTTTSYAWYNSGLQASVTTGTAVSSFAYDRDGNRTAEKHLVGTAVYQDATATWDALNRMTSFDDAGVSGGEAVEVDYEYDAVGNVRRNIAKYRELDAQGNVVTSGTPKEQDYWYLYDEMNRVTLTQGSFTGTPGSGTIGVYIGGAHDGPMGKGIAITYDLAGRRTTATRLEEHDYSFPNGHGGTTHVTRTSQWVDSYVYDAAGNHTQTWVQVGYWDSPSDYVGPTDTGTTTQKAGYDYDALGRVLHYKQYEGTTQVYGREAQYNAKSRLTWDRVTQITEGSPSTRQTWVYTTDYDYHLEATYDSGVWGGGAYMGGALTHSQTQVTKQIGSGSVVAQPATSTEHEYGWRDAAVQLVTRYDPGSGTAQVTTHTHDGLGRLVAADIADGRPRDVTFVNDADGRVLQRDEEDLLSGGDPRTLNYYFAGRRIGSISNRGGADFDRSLARDSESFGGTGATASYTVQDGDTLIGIAQRVWGDAALWYKLAEANGLTAADVLTPGQTLALPGRVQASRNAADTFRPYDPNAATGDLSPNVAPTGKGNKCGAFGVILMVVIAVAVAVTAIATAGIAAVATSTTFGNAFGALMAGNLATLGATATATGLGAAGAIGAGAAGAVVGSLASQGVGIAMGMQSRIDWKGVALAGIAGGIGTGLGEINTVAAEAGKKLSTLNKIGNVLGQSGWKGAALRGLVSSTASQGIGAATGLQQRFDLAGVAAAGIAGAASGAIPAPGVVRGMAGGIANVASRSLLTGTSFGDNIVAALPDIIGSTIGNMVADAASSKSGLRRAVDETDAAITAAADRVERAIAATSAPETEEQANERRMLQLMSMRYSGPVADSVPVGDQVAFTPEVEARRAIAAARTLQKLRDRYPDKTPPTDDAPSRPKLVDHNGVKGGETGGNAWLDHFKDNYDKDLAGFYLHNEREGKLSAGALSSYWMNTAADIAISQAASQGRVYDIERYVLPGARRWAQTDERWGAQVARYEGFLKSRDDVYTQELASAGKITLVYGITSMGIVATGGTLGGLAAGGSLSFGGAAGTLVTLDFTQAGARGILNGSYDFQSTAGGTALNQIPLTNGYGEQVYAIGTGAYGLYQLARAAPGAYRALAGPASERNIAAAAEAAPIDVAANEAAWLRAAANADGPYSLVGANRAVIDPRKLTEYALNPAHPVGGNKARVFESAFGFNSSNADDLILQLRTGVVNNPATLGRVDAHGIRFTVDIPVTGPTGNGVVRSGWIYDPGSYTPRLATAYPK